MPSYSITPQIKVSPNRIESIEKLFFLFVEDELWNESRFYELIHLQMLFYSKPNPTDPEVPN